MVCYRELFHYFRKLSNYCKLEREKENLLVISKAFLLFQSKVFSYQESNRIFFFIKKAACSWYVTEQSLLRKHYSTRFCFTSHQKIDISDALNEPVHRKRGQINFLTFVFQTTIYIILKNDCLERIYRLNIRTYCLFNIQLDTNAIHTFSKNQINEIAKIGAHETKRPTLAKQFSDFIFQTI